MKEKVLDLYLKGYRINKICKLLNISYQMVIDILDEYVKSGRLAISHNGHYKEVKNGKLILKSEGYGFIHVDGEDNDYYVPYGCNNGALDGDDVAFYSFSDGRKLKNAEVVKVIQRSKLEVIGTIIHKKRKNNVKAYVLTKYEYPLHLIKLDDINDYEDDTVVKARINYLPNQITAKVTKIVGKTDDDGIEITKIAESYGFYSEFSEETIKELEKVPDEVEPRDLKGRTDFTDKTIITIDGDDAKDFDDAISLDILKNGNYLLGVYIADVSNYVCPNTSLNEDAIKRGTSVYLADRVIPMLPFKLSNGLCSLNEGVVRLVMACQMEINDLGEIVDYKISEGFIKSRHRMTYNNVNKILNDDQEMCNKYSDIVLMLNNMNKLAHILRKKRHDAGGLNFEIDEYKISLDEHHEPNGISLRVRDEAEKLIEDFMLEANNCVASFFTKLNYPCMYRIHEKPDQEKLRDVLKIISKLGVKIKLPKNDIHSKLIQKALEDLDDNPLKPVINQMLLRTMMKAKYSTVNVGHYGLCIDDYCHFTSPIRRYPDLMVHRLLKELVLHPTNFDASYQYYSENLEGIAIMNSNSERKAIDCERDVDNMLMTWYMSKHIDEHYDGIVVSILSFGMFVMLENGVEGLVSLRNMDDYFTYDEAHQKLISASRTFSLGDKVRVVVIDAVRETSKIDLMLEEDYGDDSYGEYLYK